MPSHDSFTNRSFSSNLFSTSSASSSYPSSVSVATRISLMNVTVSSWFIRSQNRLFIIVWKVAGELVNLKYMTMGSYALMCVVNTAFHSSSFLILTLLYSHLRSSFINIFLFPTPSSISAIRDKRYLFFIVH